MQDRQPRQGRVRLLEGRPEGDPVRPECVRLPSWRILSPFLALGSVGCVAYAEILRSERLTARQHRGHQQVLLGAVPGPLEMLG